MPRGERKYGGIGEVMIAFGIKYSMICSACRELGAEQPTYELRGNSLRVRFAALQSALVDESKAPNGQGDQKDVQKENDLETRVLALIAKNNNITMSQIGQRETLYFG